MTTWALLAPGPSASAELAEKVRHLPVGAIGNAFELAPWARFIASADSGWWRKYPEARQLPGKKFGMVQAWDVEIIRLPWSGNAVNSGVLGLECAVREGATTILLLGFDMHGTHYFGPYKNGLRNTQPLQRAQHLIEYATWWQANRKRVRVVNCTEGSAIECFPKATIETCLAESAAVAA